ncbi:putative H/ACA ribonucleoprotein complex subunit 4 [Cucumispora dikerogammari]|nr:putative H/ACA ribonucleoprotein complex subunit 4 [Cucumispora dikerogammari]
MNNEPLLSNIEEMHTKHASAFVSDSGYYPNQRPLEEYLKYGTILLDKPQNPSSHEVVTWIKNILNCEKTGHAGTLDPQVSGCLNVFLNRSTRLVKSQQESGKTYVCILECDNPIDLNKLNQAIKFFVGPLLQRPPLMCAVKRNLRLRTIYNLGLIEVSGNKALFTVKCEAGTYIRTLCTHMGLFMNNNGNMLELRRIQSGNSIESEACTLHDVLDAQTHFQKTGEEIYIRRIIRPLETLLTHYKRIIVKDSAVEALCNGAYLSVAGVLKFDKNIKKNETVVVITTKGEAICLLDTQMGESEILIMDSGVVGTIKRVIMEAGVYKKSWGFSKEFDIYSDD